MSLANLSSEIILTAIQSAVTTLVLTPSDEDENVGPRVVPLDIRRFLGRLRLLEGVPFSYLVPDSLLLPPESIRFFYVDRNWTDALVQGALSVGTVNSADRAQLEQLHARVRDEVDEEERFVRLPGGEKVQQGPAGTISGFLLRSRAVSGWPAMHVRAYRREVGADDEIVPESHPDRIKVLRLERLAPAVLLALFDGVPAVVHLEEPRQGVQFGVLLKPSGAGPNSFTADVTPRDAQTSQDVPGPDLNVFFRSGAPGVLNLRRTAQEFIDRASTHMGPALDGAEFALEMIRFPYRQVFGDPAQGGPHPLQDVFRVSISLGSLKTTFLERL
jgi:hypothetical protein